MELNSAIGIAHGKVILIGEHSVVYGHNAIALPLISNILTAEIQSCKKGLSINSSLYKGLAQSAPPEMDYLIRAIERVLQEQHIVQPNISININSSLPFERGLGSSAAVVVAVLRAIYSYYNWQLSEARVLELTDFSENIAHGKSSGIDARTIIASKPLIYSRDAGIRNIAIDMDLELIIADTGIKGNTRKAVESIAQNYDKNKSHILNLSEYTNLSIEAIQNNDQKLLGQLMLKAHRSLQKLGVSHLTSDRLVESAMQINALGAKMTGGGLGGCIIALSATKNDTAKIIENLIKAGAVQTWVQELKL